MKKPLMILGELMARAAAPEVNRTCEAPLTCSMLALHPWLVQANRDEYSQIQEIGRRMGLDSDKLELWGARTLAAISIKGSATASEVVHAFKLGEASQLLRRETLTPEQMTHLRQLASEVKPNDARAAQRVRQAEQQREQKVNQPRLTSQRQPVQQPQQGPASRSVGGGALVQPWSEDRIRTAVDKLAVDSNMTGERYVRQISLMKDLLINPHRSFKDRASAFGFTGASISDSFKRIRERLGLAMDGSDIGEQLAIKVGMTSPELVARYQVPNEPGLAQRVISRVPASRREEVANLLLSYEMGLSRLKDAFISLEKIFTEEPLFAGIGLNTLEPFRRRFGGDRLTMLKNMGFTYEQMLRMNPVGDEIAHRLEPKLGTYSGQELQMRKEMGLPTTREEAALLLFTARTGPKTTRQAGQSVSYRNLLALALTSDQPSSMPRDLQQAYERVRPNIISQAAAADMSVLFKAVEFRYGISIERSTATAAWGRGYREQINTLMLKLYGMGARSMSTGKIESIPTDFQPSMSPSSSNKPEPGQRREKSEPSSGEDATTWKDLLPLLKPPADGR